MNICLISPKVGFTTDIKELNALWKNLAEESPNWNIWSGISTGLLTLAALTPKHWQITFIDENFDQINFKERYDLVGITIMTQQALRGYHIAQKFRKKGIPVIIGGVHATLNPNEALVYADSIVIGEAELVWNHLLTDLKENKLKKIYKSSKLVQMTESPIPRYDLLDHKNYHYFWLQTSRGCPHKCEYCTASKIFGSGYRTKSISQLKSELEMLKSISPHKPIFFADDNFLVKKSIANEVINTLEGAGIRWQAQCDISIGKDKYLIRKLKQSGCHLLFIGFESLSEKGLSEIDGNGWKRKQLNNYENYIENIQSEGIGIMGAFIVGLDSDTPEVFNNIINFAQKNWLYHTSCTILTPFLGTKVRERLLIENRLLNTTWDKYSGYCVNYTPKNMSIMELEKGIYNLYKELYETSVQLEKMEHFMNIQRELRTKGKRS